MHGLAGVSLDLPGGVFLLAAGRDKEWVSAKIFSLRGEDVELDQAIWLLAQKVWNGSLGRYCEPA